MQTSQLVKPQVNEISYNRLLEVIPGALTWLFLIGPIILSLVYPILIVYFVIGFDLIWLFKSFRLSYFLIKGYSTLHRNRSIDWVERLEGLDDLEAKTKLLNDQMGELRAANPKLRNPLRFGQAALAARRRYFYLQRELAELKRLEPIADQILDRRSLVNAVIMATYNESLQTIEPSVKALTQLNYPGQQMMLVIAYEERGGEEVERNANYLIEEYGDFFAEAIAIKHPANLAGEIRGKGSNLTYAARIFTERIRARGIDPGRVIVTTLDADNRPNKEYFAYLSYVYAAEPNRVHRSYQPIPMFYNNIWDVPAPMRIVATGSSFWQIIETMRPHRLRNFSAHAQSLQTLIDTDYWSVTSIVEDGHQFWRTYFRYNGDHQVVPLFTPIYQDAVLAKSYPKTIRAQYVQLRRWAWGISDFPYVVNGSFKHKDIKLSEKLAQIWRLFEGHFSWATAPLILTFGAWLPLWLNHRFGDLVLAHNLPVIASWILRLSIVGMLVTVFISLISLPPRPARYRRAKGISMVTQWVLLPFMGIVFSAFAAIDAQTRLMLGRYLDFRVTEKAVKG